MGTGCSRVGVGRRNVRLLWAKSTYWAMKGEGNNDNSAKYVRVQGDVDVYVLIRGCDTARVARQDFGLPSG